MDTSTFVSSTAELALDLVEKRGVVVPFCRAIADDGAVVIYSPETNDATDAAFRNAEANQRGVVLGEIEKRKLVGLAFCKEVTLTMSEPDEVLSAIRVEFHHVGAKSLVYLFPYRMRDGEATVLPFYTRDVEPIQLWTSDSA